MQDNSVQIPWIIQKYIINLVIVGSGTYKSKEISRLDLVCWRWFKECSEHPACRFAPFTPFEMKLDEIYLHTKSKYCVKKSVDRVHTRFQDNGTTPNHQMLLDLNDWEWLKTFYGSLSSVYIQIGSNKFLPYFIELFKDIIPKLNDDYQQSRIRGGTEGDTDGGDESTPKYGLFTDFLIQSTKPHEYHLKHKVLSLVTPYASKIQTIHYYMDYSGKSTGNIYPFIEFLKHTKELNNLAIFFRFKEDEADEATKALMDALPSTIMSLRYIVSPNLLSFTNLSTKLPKLRSLALENIPLGDRSGELLDYISSNSTLTRCDTVLEYNEQLIPILQNKTKIRTMAIRFTPEFFITKPKLKIHNQLTGLYVYVTSNDPFLANELIETCQQLKNLTYSAEVMGVDTSQSIVRLVKELANLEHFNFSCDDKNQDNPNLEEQILDESSIKQLIQEISSPTTTTKLKTFYLGFPSDGAVIRDDSINNLHLPKNWKLDREISYYYSLHLSHVEN